ncbi:MAG: ATP synthase F0 subunit C [Planctomycetes bacterium]|nr:ATP synthase F0 subunit C [Planctomycetota bacterium]
MILVLILFAVTDTAVAQEVGSKPAADSGFSGQSVVKLGACLTAAVAVIGGSLGIGRIATSAVESVARQPEAAGQMFLAWLLPSAMIEGVTLFAIVLCLIAVLD